MKKILILLSVVTLLVCATVPVSADEIPTGKEVCRLPVPENTMTQEELELYNALSDMKAESGVMPAAEGSHTVRVTTPVDAQFRNKYSSWAWEVLRAVDDADDYLGEQFNINYSIVSNKLWSSTASDVPEDLLDEAISEWGLRDNADLMIAFTGRDIGWGGTSYIGTKYCLVADSSRSGNTFGVQHETGHCYELNHCIDGSCLMHHAAGIEELNNLDTSCRNFWYARRTMH